MADAPQHVDKRPLSIPTSAQGAKQKFWPSDLQNYISSDKVGVPNAPTYRMYFGVWVCRMSAYVNVGVCTFLTRVRTHRYI